MGAEPVHTDGVLWLLAQQLADMDDGIALQRQAMPDRMQLTAQFRRTAGSVRIGAAAGCGSGDGSDRGVVSEHA
ncbi:MAG: hypothetical protein P3W97_010165 [Tepidimonas sp.]|uniref:hypothetical protein n=1 Tax=Tepidimonas sp. TaxID=2002775 RepID=UPI00259F3533|nr:hypothetical protein [Tepidimonas sp.]MDM7457594.1 hypothetical protein [Tepidimonas sp.]